MTQDRENLASIAYWHENEQRIAQHFYISFCLLVSAVQDSFLGQCELVRNNFNWSATCCYYSLVHIGRLLCFLAIGDFPTSHASLRTLFSCEPQRNPIRPPRNLYPFDWLQGFRKFEAPPETRLERIRAPEQIILDMKNIIINYLEQNGIADLQNRLNKYGKIINAAGPLRNDSNYEALLIAHEYKHANITDAFISLAETMAQASKISLLLAREAFTSFLEHDPCVQQRRDAYYSLAREYVGRRILEAMKKKIGDIPPLIEKLQIFIQDIVPSSEHTEYDTFERNISRSLFSNKNGLMTQFEKKIKILREAVD